MADINEIPTKEVVTEMKNGFDKRQKSKSSYQHNETLDSPMNAFSTPCSSNPLIFSKDFAQLKSSSSCTKIFDESDKTNLVLESLKHKSTVNSTKSTASDSVQRGSSTSNPQLSVDSDKSYYLFDSFKRQLQLESNNPVISDFTKQEFSASSPKVFQEHDKSEMVLKSRNQKPTLESTKLLTPEVDKPGSSSTSTPKQFDDYDQANFLLESLKRKLKMDSTKSSTSDVTNQKNSDASFKVFDGFETKSVRGSLQQKQSSKSIKTTISEVAQQEASIATPKIFEHSDKSNILLESLKPKNLSESTKQSRPDLSHRRISKNPQIFDQADKSKLLLESLKYSPSIESTKLATHDLAQYGCSSSSNAKFCDVSDKEKCSCKSSKRKSSKSSKIKKSGLAQPESTQPLSSNSKNIDELDSAQFLQDFLKPLPRLEPSKPAPSDPAQEKDVPESSKRKHKSKSNQRKIRLEHTLQDLLSEMEPGCRMPADRSSPEDPAKTPLKDGDQQGFTNDLPDLLDYINAFEKTTVDQDENEMSAEEMLQASAENLAIMRENSQVAVKRMTSMRDDLEGMRRSIEEAIRVAPRDDPSALDELLEGMRQVSNMQIQLTANMAMLNGIQGEIEQESKQRNELEEHHNLVFERLKKAEEIYKVYRDEEAKVFEDMAREEGWRSDSSAEVPSDFSEGELDEFKEKLDEEIKNASIANSMGSAERAGLAPQKGAELDDLS